LTTETEAENLDW